MPEICKTDISLVIGHLEDAVKIYGDLDYVPRIANKIRLMNRLIHKLKAKIKQ